MQAWKITDVKSFMNHMLVKETFDDFLLSEATITTKASFVIDGHLVEDYYTPEELEVLNQKRITCVSFGEVRSLCFDIIKGKKTPGYFKFVFLMNPEGIAQILERNQIVMRLEDISNLSVNIRYQTGELYVTTGSSLKVFTPDKSVDQAWDRWVEMFLSDNEILYEKFS